MPSKRPIPRQSLPDAIANDIRERILNGELVEGEVIRQEALADEYDVSRMPIREALKRLDAEGLVQFTTNRGASVTKHSLREIGEIFDLRILLEVDLFRRAIPLMGPKDFAACEAVLDRMEQAYDAEDIGKWGALNFEYHSALYAAAGRGLTHELLQRVNLQSDRYVRMHLSATPERGPIKQEHRDLLNLAQEGKIDEACATLAHHIARPKGHLLELVAAQRASEAG